MDFFNDCITEADRKARYRKLSKLFHPDTGGDAELFRQLTDQYENPISQTNFSNPFESSYSSFFTRTQDISDKIRQDEEIDRLNAIISSLNMQVMGLKAKKCESCTYFENRYKDLYRLYLDLIKAHELKTDELDKTQEELSNEQQRCREILNNWNTENKRTIIEKIWDWWHEK